MRHFRWQAASVLPGLGAVEERRVPGLMSDMRRAVYSHLALALR